MQKSQGVVEQDLPEVHFPGLIKSNRARNIVRRSLIKSKTKTFTMQVDTILNIVSELYMIEQQQAKHPDMIRASALALQRREAHARLIKAHAKLLALV